jgi:hypothetical protein
LQQITLPRMKKTLFASCADCGAKAFTAREFSDHAHACAVKPLNWKPTADYFLGRAGDKKKKHKEEREV